LDEQEKWTLLALVLERAAALATERKLGLLPNPRRGHV